METRVSSHGSGQGQSAETKLRLMAVHAHPDDESSKGAATMARYVREGVEVLVATMTGGERGSVLNAAMDRPEVLADLPNIRRAEMARAREILGVEQRFLGFVDSGLPEGDPLPPLPEGSFALVPLAEAAAPLVRLVREFQPHVILTYDESGGYPHPDHIKTHQVAVEAFEAAADPDRYPEIGGEPWQPSKMYYFVTFHQAKYAALHEELLRRDLESPYTEIFAEWEERARKRLERGQRTLEITTRVRRPITSACATTRCARTPPRSTPTARGSRARARSSASPGRPRTIILLGRSSIPSCRKTTFSRVSGRV